MDSRDEGIPYGGRAKQEGGDSTKAMMGASSSSRQWSGFKNPRIVRVSRTFGGKDRHSKVCTVKGLRDRRIRLSVPTAIQLYDLQDRLGLSQPSKVIDWLLDTTKNDIDELPPLPIVPGSFPLFHQGTYANSQGYGASQTSSNYTPFLDANLLSLRKEGININSDMEVDREQEQSLVAKLKYWDSSVVTRLKQKGVDNNQGGVGESTSSQAQNFFPMASNNGTNMLPPSSLLTNPMFNYNWEPSSNLSLTQFGGLGLPSQNYHHQGAQGNSSHHPSSLSLSSGSQLFLYPSMATPSLLPPQNSFSNSHNQQMENELRQFNRFHLSNSLSSSSLHNPSGLELKPFPLSMSHHSNLHQNDERHQDKGD